MAGIPPSAINLSPALDQGYGLNAFQFGPDDLLYSPDTTNNQIISIDVDSMPGTGIVKTVVPSSKLVANETPIALKIDRNGILYFVCRRSGNVYKFNLTTQHLTLLVTVEPALDNCSLSLDQTKLYVTNDENKIYQVDVNTGETENFIPIPYCATMGYSL